MNLETVTMARKLTKDVLIKCGGVMLAVFTVAFHIAIFIYISPDSTL